MKNGGGQRIAVSGTSGLIGSALIPTLRAGGHEVRRLVRPESPNARVNSPTGVANGPGAAGTGGLVGVDIAWDPARGTIDAAALEGVDAVIHLSGENLAQRWSPEVKARIRASRVESTRLLASTLARLRSRPRVFVCASAIGIYGDRGSEIVDEGSQLGRDFLASVARDWEAATAPAAQAGVRVVNTRFGIALSAAGGALAKMLPPFRLGAGGKLGSGKQWWSWVAIDDLVAVIHHAIRRERLSGPVNVVSPHPVTNEDFTEILGRVLERPTLVTVPAFALHLAFGGEMADATLLSGQRVRPTRLFEDGFQFKYPDVDGALRHVLRE